MAGPIAATPVSNRTDLKEGIHMSEVGDKLALALRHLEHVQAAWFEPTDWDDLSL